jgi:hypothetical protein
VIGTTGGAAGITTTTFCFRIINAVQPEVDESLLKPTTL